MLEKRAFDTLGRFSNDWLNARYHFSFGDYHDPSRMGWGALRVWNDDEIAVSGGFAPHPHRDMEIITYVRKGAISHRDSLGQSGRTAAGDVQVMSAGSGIRHSEFNRENEQTELFQIWIEPAVRNVEPRWDTARFPRRDRAGQWTALASGEPERDGGLLIRQDARVMGLSLEPGQTTRHALQAGRHAYLVAAYGEVEVNGVLLNTRDGLAVTDESDLVVKAQSRSDLVMVDTL